MNNEIIEIIKDSVKKLSLKEIENCISVYSGILNDFPKDSLVREVHRLLSNRKYRLLGNRKKELEV
jgi:hypothetical protein